MHYWGDEGVDWAGINDAAEFIGEGLKRWGRMDVRQYKEKFGEVRVYCDIGLFSIQQLWYPGYCFNQWRKWYSKWLWNFEFRWVFIIPRMLMNIFFMPYHRWLYRRFYREAVLRWPHLRDEIVGAADLPELLRDLTGHTRLVLLSDHLKMDAEDYWE